MERLKEVCFLCLFLSTSYLYSLSISDSSYYPMTLGNEWEFYSDFDPHSEMIVDTLRREGVLYYGFSRLMSEPEYWLREHENRVYFLNVTDSTEFILFDFTIDVGDSIELPSGYECSFGQKIFLISKIDTIVTSDSTYYNCYHFVHRINCMDAGIFDTWFSKGIGKVKYIANYFVGIKEFLLKNYSIITSTDVEYDIKIINSYKLFQNYPNPFNPITTIEFDLPKTTEVTLKIYNIHGEEVVTLVSDRLSTGNHTYKWNASNMASGVYLYRLDAGDFVETKKMILMR